MVTPKARDRLLRNFVAAILQSDLSKEEIRKVSRDLISGREFASELGRLLVKHLKLFEADTWIIPAREASSDRVRFALELIRLNGLTKVKVLELLQKASLSKLQTYSSSASLRLLLKRFFSEARSEEVDGFMAALEAEVKQDPYLKGIIKGR